LQGSVRDHLAFSYDADYFRRQKHRAFQLARLEQSAGRPIERKSWLSCSGRCSVKVVQSLDEVAWRHFVEEHPKGNIFHTPEMFQVFAHTINHTPHLWAVTDESAGVLALLLPVQITLIPYGRLLGHLTSRRVVYGSVLCASNDQGQQALALLLKTYRQSVGNNGLFTELRNLSDHSRIQPILVEHGFGYQKHLNFLIDLDCTSDALMQGINRRTRKNIRRGLRKGKVTIEEVDQLEQVSVCYDILCKTYARAKVPLAHRSLFEAAFRILFPKNMVKFLLARVGDAYAAASVELVYKDTIFGWYGGTDRDFGRHVPNELLMWHILNWGAENRYRLYDFGGAGTPDEEYGVRDFKAKFGGKLVCYGRNTLVHSPTQLRLSKLGFKVYRALGLDWVKRV
jgi:serine/alanine adding enzyme